MSQEIAAFGSNARFAAVALVNGAVGVVVAPRGQLLLAIAVTIDGEKITGYELIADPARLEQLNLGVLDALGG